MGVPRRSLRIVRRSEAVARLIQDVRSELLFRDRPCASHRDRFGQRADCPDLEKILANKLSFSQDKATYENFESTQ